MVSTSLDGFFDMNLTISDILLQRTSHNKHYVEESAYSGKSCLSFILSVLFLVFVELFVSWLNSHLVDFELFLEWLLLLFYLSLAG